MIPNIRYGLGVIMICHCRFIICNKCLSEDVGNGRHYACGRVGMYGDSILSAKYCWEPKTAINIKLWKKRRRLDYWVRGHRDSKRLIRVEILEADGKVWVVRVWCWDYGEFAFMVMTSVGSGGLMVTTVRLLEFMQLSQDVERIIYVYIKVPGI